MTSEESKVTSEDVICKQISVSPQLLTHFVSSFHKAQSIIDPLTLIWPTYWIQES